TRAPLKEDGFGLAAQYTGQVSHDAARSRKCHTARIPPGTDVKCLSYNAARSATVAGQQRPLRAASAGSAMTDQVGISGFAVYVPPYRVDLESWCRWTNNPWDKTRAVVGHSFRMRGPAQSVYTMAATAVMRLIDRYGIDPRRVGFLGLGTESSTDNSAGAVIVKGMLDEGLQASG